MFPFVAGENTMIPSTRSTQETAIAGRIKEIKEGSERQRRTQNHGEEPGRGNKVLSADLGLFFNVRVCESLFKPLYREETSVQKTFVPHVPYI